MLSGLLRIDAGRSAWLALAFLALGIVVPTVCILWFMNEAARAQSEATKQSVAEAYRGQLRFLGDRLDSWWVNRLEAIDRSAGDGRSADFARVVKAGLADSVVLAHYPALASSAAADPKAVAAQQQIRGLVRTDKAAALRAIEEHFGNGRLTEAADADGRLIAADEQLLALRLIPPGDSQRASTLRRLAALLNDYDHSKMPAAQRLFLMDEVRGVTPDASWLFIECRRCSRPPARFSMTAIKR